MSPALEPFPWIQKLLNTSITITQYFLLVSGVSVLSLPRHESSNGGGVDGPAHFSCCSPLIFPTVRTGNVPVRHAAEQVHPCLTPIEVRAAHPAAPPPPTLDRLCCQAAP